MRCEEKRSKVENGRRLSCNPVDVKLHSSPLLGKLWMILESATVEWRGKQTPMENNGPPGRTRGFTA